MRLLRTTLYGTHVMRPQVLLQLDQFGGRQEMRRTGVRERWARNKGSLRHGIVEWSLRFSFAVEVPAAGAVEGARFGVPERLVQGRFFEVCLLVLKQHC